MKIFSPVSILISVLLFIIPACDDEPGTKAEQAARVLVLCDVSNSTTLLSSTYNTKGMLEKLKYYIKKIPKWYPLQSEIFYYPVSDNLISEQLSSKISYNIKLRSELEPQKAKAELSTNEVCHAIDSLAITKPSSCILLSVNRAVKRFRELINDNPGENYSNELIIISDMIESCRISDSTEISMSVLNTAKLNAALLKFEKENPGLNVSDLNLTVRIIINSPWMGSRFTSIQQAWEAWFAKIGLAPNKLFFYTGEPDIEENPLLHKR